MEQTSPAPNVECAQSQDDKVISRRLNRKIDIALLPFLSLLYLFNGLDRSNIGNAETQGFSQDIGATPDDLNLAVSLFFVTFVLLQPPSAAVGRWLGAKHWITFIMVGWGIFTISNAFIRGHSALIAMRLMVGAFEAGFYPTAVAYLSCFYCRYDLAARLALFYGQYAIAVKDWKTWYVLLFNIGASVPNQTFSIFLPLVVQGLGYSSIEANLMSVPPYVCGALGLYLFALGSDHRKERGYHIVVGISISLVGLIISVVCKASRAKYVGLCVLLFGSYIAAPLTVAWLSGNTPEPGKRSLVLGVNGFGNLAGVIGSQLYKKRYAPKYLFPFYMTLGFVAAALVGYISYRFTLEAANMRKKAVSAGKSIEEIHAERVDNKRYADRKWTFLYGL